MATLGAVAFGAVPRIGATVGEAEEEAGVAPDAAGLEDMANIDTFYCCWGLSNFM